MGEQFRQARIRMGLEPEVVSYLLSIPLPVLLEIEAGEREPEFPELFNLALLYCKELPLMQEMIELCMNSRN